MYMIYIYIYIYIYFCVKNVSSNCLSIDLFLLKKKKDSQGVISNT